MWTDRSTPESTRISLYWDQVVSGGSSNPGGMVESNIDPTLIQTISWLERIDDAQPASAEFSMRFETEFLKVIGAVSAQPSLQTTRSTTRRETLPRVAARREPLRFPDAHAQRRRLLVSIAAGLLLFLALGIAYYARNHLIETRHSNVILAPSSAIDVPMDRGDAARSGVMPGPSIANGMESSWHFEAGRSDISAPAVAGDMVFITSGSEMGSGSGDQGSIIAIDALTGSERWRFPTEHATASTPAIVDGIVYAGDMSGIVYALDTGTGEAIWQQDLESGWTSAPVVVDDTVYIAVAPFRASLHVAVQDGTVVVGSGLSSQPGDGFDLYALDRTSGDVQWRSGGDRFRQPGLFAFDTERGMLAWQFDMPSLESGPAISGRQVYAGSTLDGTISALNLASGAAEWIASIGEDLPIDSSPAISGGSLFVTTAFGQIICLDGSSGAERWRAATEHISLNSSAVVIGSVLYVVDTNWGLSAFSTTDGSTLWSEQLDLSGQVVASPVIVNGTLFIGTSLESDSAYVATLWAFSGSSDTNREAT